ncbi:MAG: valine--tRNA ligase [Candidatus Latescibacteria bacterium]|nr:valine--tRNA ligase [Candidatus Latescibacterota bacterium]
MSIQTLEKKYDPNLVEQKWYRFWEERAFFHAQINPSEKSYCITIPPPNVTGELHMGHALQHTIHDAMIRWRRMQGDEALCLPGSDHAGIPTQMKVERLLYEEEGKTRFDVGREGLLERVWAWRQKYGDAIWNQFRMLGCSYDWRRERFTLDEEYRRAVSEAFVRFYKKGWIYRGKRMVNWCTYCGTVISDLEVEERELNGHLWHIRYPGTAGGPDVVVATTRPETMLGDTGVAVHPTDKRWRHAVGKQVMLPLMERPIPIVADEYADPKMGSGAVKVTPAHDPNDYEVGQRHDLPEIQVIGFDGKMTEKAGDFAGLDTLACRKAVVDALKELGLLERVETYTHAVPHHDKCGTPVEPLPMEQWFVRMKELAARALPVLEQGEITYVPDRFREYSIEWLRHIRDWCISRQIWWGHRIPVWTCPNCGELIVRVEPPTECPKCGGGELEQDPDVLDTWFSSALWPFAVLGWPEKTPELSYFYPTDLMITGRDILYLWVVRMIMTSLEFVGKIPFRTVFIHPTIQTKDGQRMSKTLGTGIDPLELIERYGTDATRFSLLMQCGSAQDIRFDADVVDNRVQSAPAAETCRNFCNKIWNAARMVMMYVPEGTEKLSPSDGNQVTDLVDRWILSRLERTVSAVTEALASTRFNDATRALYDFFWHDYCDWYLEAVKPRLSGDGEETRRARGTMECVLDQAMRLLHPFMPFISEEIWQKLGVDKDAESLMIAAWPEAKGQWVDAEAEREMAVVRGLVGAVRIIRSEMRVPPGKRVHILIRSTSEERLRMIEKNRDHIVHLSKAEKLTVGKDLEKPDASASAVVGEAEIFVPLEGIIDVKVERARLKKEMLRIRKALTGLEKKLADSRFLDNAPTEVVERERAKRVTYEASLEKLARSLEML